MQSMLSLASRSLSCVLRRWRASAQLLVRIAVLLNFGRIVVFMLALLFVGPAAAGQEGTDMRLEDMGFVMRPANAPEQLERLRLLPPRNHRPNQKRHTLLHLRRSRLLPMRVPWQRTGDEKLQQSCVAAAASADGHWIG